MTDAISRSALLRSLEEAEQRVLHDGEWPYTASVLAKAIVKVKQYVAELPTIDAVPVVRCKDCQYAIPLDGHAFRRWGNNALNCTECRGDDGFGMAGVSLAYHDGFCDMGVRRECEPHG